MCALYVTKVSRLYLGVSFSCPESIHLNENQAKSVVFHEFAIHLGNHVIKMHSVKKSEKVVFFPTKEQKHNLLFARDENLQQFV
jgi:hypothetical protein